MSTATSPPLPEGLPDTPAARVANRLHSVAIRLLRGVRSVDRKTGLSGERLSLLSVLVFAGPRTFSELARAEMVSRPAITRIVKSLEAAKLVRREPVPGDRRQVMLHATTAGRLVMERGRARRVERIADELSGLSTRELQTLERATRILAERPRQQESGR